MPEREDHESRFPNLYLAGAAKAGSTTLWAALGEHPDIFAPSVKEPHWMASDLDLPPDICVREVEDYLALYSEGVGHRYMLDASPTSLLSPGAAAKIAKVCPTAQILIVLRDPVETVPAIHDQLVVAGRAKSSDLGRAVRYAASVKGGSLEGLGVEAFRRYHDVVAYGPQVQRFYDHFPPEQVRVLLLDDLRRDPTETWAGVLDHLGLAFVPADLSPRNSSRRPRSSALQRLIRESQGRFPVPRSMRRQLRALRRAVVRANIRESPRPPMDRDLRAALVEDLGPVVDDLAAVLGRSLSNWAREEEEKE